LARRKSNYLDDWYRIFRRYGADLANLIFPLSVSQEPGQRDSGAQAPIIPPQMQGQPQRSVDALAKATRQLFARMRAAVARGAQDGRSMRQALANAVRVANAGRPAASAEAKEGMRRQMEQHFIETRIRNAPPLLRILLSEREEQGRRGLFLDKAGRGWRRSANAKYSTMLGAVANHWKGIAQRERRESRAAKTPETRAKYARLAKEASDANKQYRRAANEQRKRGR